MLRFEKLLIEFENGIRRVKAMNCGRCRYYKGVGCGKKMDMLASKCESYENKYIRTDCEHYLAEVGECRVLTLHGGVPPCAKPRLKKDGMPVRCTFYKKRV